MFSTAENVESLLLNVGNMWQTGAFAWKSCGEYVENAWKRRNRWKKEPEILVQTGVAAK